MCSTTPFGTLVKGPLATVVDETHVRDYDYKLRAARSTPSCSSARSTSLSHRDEQTSCFGVLYEDSSSRRFLPLGRALHILLACVYSGSVLFLLK